MGYAGYGLVILYKNFRNKIVQGNEKQYFDLFKSQIDMILYEYIKTDLIACENTLTAVSQRHSRVIALVGCQRSIKDLCQEDLDLKNQQ